eukprot:scaffold4853_cov154-Pinguiococcus_pyrenoidosus.AAC.1
MNALMILFSVAAAGRAATSSALTREFNEYCEMDYVIVGYGVGMSATLCLWLVGQILVLLFPCGCLTEDKDQPFAKCCVYVPKAPMPLASSVDVEAKEDEEVPITTGHLVKECTLDPAVEASS